MLDLTDDAQPYPIDPWAEDKTDPYLGGGAMDLLSNIFGIFCPRFFVLRHTCVRQADSLSIRSPDAQHAWS
jgi:hypothetical protein